MQKISWLSVLQGYSMLLVVIGHITLTNIYGDPNTPIASAIENCIYSFHMPLFMFISGYLFFLTCLKPNKPYRKVIIGKLQRLGLPFIAFTLATTILKLIFTPLMKRPVDLEELINTFVFFKSNPLGEMWFIITLVILMALYPLYREVIKNRYTEIIGLVIALGLYYFFPRSFHYYQLGKVSEMLIFFYTGILMCKYDYTNILKSKTALVVTLVLFILLQSIALPSYLVILVKSIGIIFSFSLCLNIAPKFPNLFSSFRNYTFQIFLMGIFFQMAIRFLYIKIGTETLYIPMYILSILLGIYMPVFISKAIQKINIKFIRGCFGL